MSEKTIPAWLAGVARFAEPFNADRRPMYPHTVGEWVRVVDVVNADKDRKLSQFAAEQWTRADTAEAVIAGLATSFSTLRAALAVIDVRPIAYPVGDEGVWKLIHAARALCGGQS